MATKTGVKRSIFQNREFRLLFTAQVISLTGSGVTTVALALFAHQLVGGGSAAVVIGNALMLRILAFLIFSQPAGLLGGRLEYAWQTGGDRLYYDLHGEPTGDKTGYFKSFEEKTASQSRGSVTADFAGPHGWYWENKSRHPVAIILNTRGSYQILGLMP